jgi:DnaK suppressor protein
MARREKIQLIRTILVKKMEELCFNAHNTKTKLKNTDGGFTDPLDHAATETNKFVELACRDRERALMLDVKETIMRIDKGLFGISDHCGRVIHEKRLLIEPMSKLCMECQEEKESAYKRKNMQWSVRGVACHHA